MIPGGMWRAVALVCGNKLCIVAAVDRRLCKVQLAGGGRVGRVGMVATCATAQLAW